MRVAFGDSQLDTDVRTLERDGQPVPVEPKVFDLLVYLIEHRDRLASSEELLDTLWPGISVGPASLSRAVHKARQAVGDDGERQAVLRTVQGRGFQFVAEISDIAAPETRVPPAGRSSRARWIAPAGGAALLLAVASYWLLGRPAPETPLGHTLAVLPFVNMSPDPDQGYFADGISEELLNTVAPFDGLRVVGRSSSFSFRNSDADLRTIGEALGADVILEGSVRTEGDRVRITAQLVDAEDGLQRWSESYDRELGDLFAIQTEIATAIATALHVALSSDQHQRLAKPPTRNLAAYQAYLLGRQRLAKGTTETTEEAIGYFQEAIELDPEFALAHAGLTDGYLNQFEDSGRPPDETMGRAEIAAAKALQLDDSLAEAHVALGAVEWYRNDFERAEVAFQRALELNPNSVDALRSYANLLGVDLRRFAEALPLARRAVELDPISLDAVVGLGESLNFVGRFDEALAQFERALEIDPAHPYAYTQIGMHHRYVLGQIDEATLWMSKALALDPRSQFNLAVQGWQMLDLDDPDRAEVWFDRAEELGTEGFWPNVSLQALAVYRGDGTAAREHGRKAFARWASRYPFTFLRDQAVREGRYGEARGLYEELHPELVHQRAPEIDDRNYQAAIDLVLILSRTGEHQYADWLLGRSLEQLQRMPRLGRGGYAIADVQIHALRGETGKALAALREAIDQGWRAEWWSWVQKPDLEPLHDEPEFQAMLAEIRADMAAQLEHVREMERRGELVFPTELATPGSIASGSPPPDPR